MRRFVAVVSLAFGLCLLALPVRPQSSGTTLTMLARWDNNKAIKGTVTLSQVNLTGPNTVIAQQALSSGRTSITVPLAANAVYNVTLVDSAGTQLVNFPITTALINPTNLSSAQINLVVHAANNTLASANLQVSMSF
jgi:hypothetical protein